MQSTQLGRSILLRGGNLTQHFPRAHEAHNLKTWGSLLRTMKICMEAAMLDLCDVCHPALKQLCATPSPYQDMKLGQKNPEPLGNKVLILT